MKETLTIAAVALSIEWADVARNLDNAEKCIVDIIENVCKPDVIVFPELFTTGFISDKVLLSEIVASGDHITISKARQWAERFSCAISGGYLAAGSDGRPVNRAFFIKPTGEISVYDKRHLFSLSAEYDLLAAGEQLPPVIDFQGWKISMVICYDLRFPVWCRNRHYDYDVMLVPANWPQARRHAWHTLLSARAIENQASYVGCDRSGCDEFGIYDGMSLITDAYGMSVGQTVKIGDKHEAVIAKLQRGIVDQCRRRMPAANDMDHYVIDIP